MLRNCLFIKRFRNITEDIYQQHCLNMAHLPIHFSMVFNNTKVVEASIIVPGRDRALSKYFVSNPVMNIPISAPLGLQQGSVQYEMSSVGGASKWKPDKF